MKVKVCAEPNCGQLTTSSRCNTHTPRRAERNTTAHKKARAQTLREEHVCWICGKPPIYGDPLTADHIIPRARGGLNVRNNYRAAHLSCNSSRADKRA